MATSSSGSLSRPIPRYPLDWELPWEKEAQEEKKKKEEGQEQKMQEEKETEDEKKEKEKEEEEERKMLDSPRVREHVYPILCTAKAIEKDSRRVAYLCRFSAYLVANAMDPDSIEPDIQKFKTRLLYKLEKDEKDAWRQLAATDTLEIQRFWKQYCKNVERSRETWVQYCKDLMFEKENYSESLENIIKKEKMEQKKINHDEEAWRQLAATDAQQIQRFWEQNFKILLEKGLETEKSLKLKELKLKGELKLKDELKLTRNTRDTLEKQRKKIEMLCNMMEMHRKMMERHDKIGPILNDVRNFLTQGKYDPEIDEYPKWFKEKASFSPYNILPVNIPEPVMEIPEIKAALELILRRTDNLPKPKSVSENMDGPDLFCWLQQTFGFQKGNVENQKEHLILLLANIDMRKRGERDQSEIHSHVIHNDTVTFLMKKILHNYISWCRYLHLEPNLKIPRGASTQQPELLYIGLYLLIWGEASNVRFMPECLCYIFHHMAKYLYDIISNTREDPFDPPFGHEGTHDAFLHVVIHPIFTAMQEEAAMSKRGTTSHSKWRNYDDFNEYFWSKKCFKQLKWPMDMTADFFAVPRKSKNETEKHDHEVTTRRIPKTNFVELRTSLILFRSFKRMWSFLILAFQAMAIIAWSPSGCISSIFEPSVFRNLMTIFITDAFLNFFHATLEIVLTWKAWSSLECSQMIRYVLKFVIALAWLIILPTTYINYVLNPTGLVKFFSNWIGSLKSESIYNYAVTLYVLPNLFSTLLFVFLPFRRALEYSNSRIVRTFLWWSQPKLYIPQGMYDDTTSLLKYMLFWITLLICKLTFSFYVEISPLVGPTREIIYLGWGTYKQGFLPYLLPNFGVIISVWVPIAMVYFMDTQIWYSIFSAVCGGISGVFSRLGELQTMTMLRSRFKEIPSAFDKNLVPKHGSQSNKSELEEGKKNRFDEFSDTWNEFIISLREEDLISNRERTLLTVASSMATGDTTVFQWPPFLLVGKIPRAVDVARTFNIKDDELKKEIKQDPYTYDAVIECYQTLLSILYGLMNEASSTKKALDHIRDAIEESVRRGSFLNEFYLDKLPYLIGRLDILLFYLENYDIGRGKTRIANSIMDIMEMITKDFMKNGKGIFEDRFIKINLDSMKGRSWREKCARLQLLLTTRESGIYIANLEARRRILFFANSLFMKMPRAPQVHSMMSFSVLTPCMKEDSEQDLWKNNEHGLPMLSILQKIYPDEFRNFLERIDFKPRHEDDLKDKMDEICLWASHRGQTLSKTVRGMMYHRRALVNQCIQDKDLDKFDSDKIAESSREARAIADIKFTYVVACPIYRKHKNFEKAKDQILDLNILNLMETYPSLRVAYIEEIQIRTGNGTKEKTYYSVLVKGAGHKQYEEIYRIKLPGKPTDIGERKAEIQNQAIIFTRGEALQAIDTNQDNYLEESFKLRNLLEEFESEKYGKSKPTILGFREHIFTGSFVSSFGSLMSNQETSFVTIGQRVLANHLKVRFHYGHSDIFDRLFHITRGGISKASKTLNMSEGIFSGFNSIMRGGIITHHEYIQVGRGLDDGMNQISSFEGNIASGCGEQTLSRDLYRLAHRFDFFRMLSLYFTTVGFYFNGMVTVLTVYVFLYGRLYLIIIGLEKPTLLDQLTTENIRPLEIALASESVFQLGFLLVLPMLMEFTLESDFPTALGEFVIMKLPWASIFFTFLLGTRTHYYGKTILHGGATCKSRGHEFIPYHAKFAENYRLYSRSHFVKGLELLMLLTVYQLCGSSHHSSCLYRFLTFSTWFLVASWLFAPFLFNPSGFEWHRAVEDWKDWMMWMGKQEGFGISVDQSWEAWWECEQEPLRKTSIHALLLEFILSCRFLVYHCGFLYYLNIARPSQSTLVYALSWLVVFAILVGSKVDSLRQQRFGTTLQILFRILKGLVFLGSVLLVSVLFIVANFTISDVFISIIGFISIGWYIILIGQACSPFLRKTMLWDTAVELARAYDYVIGFIIFFPIAVLSLLPYTSECQTRFIFMPAYIRGLQLPRILASSEKY
ncbi:unnamed protein product [Urochloa decumbens]|uniref:1,3-beta-glucan synthase n=1 Tax=Urochloa decumbens TaxID=240449 RepID=A0ABC9CZN7_9POAL